MDGRLRAPLDLDSLVFVAGLAAGYAGTSVPALAAMEMRAGLDHVNPVGTLTRLTHRIVAVHAADVGGFIVLARRSAYASTVRAQTLAAALVVLALATGAPVAARDADLYLDADAVGGCPDGWPDRLDGGFAALRATMVTLTGRRVGGLDCTSLITSAAAARLPR